MAPFLNSWTKLEDLYAASVIADIHQTIPVHSNSIWVGKLPRAISLCAKCRQKLALTREH